jgi:class 3 adenylate cyclase
MDERCAGRCFGERNLFSLALAIDRGQNGQLHLSMRNDIQRRLAAILAADVVGYSRAHEEVDDISNAD